MSRKKAKLALEDGTVFEGWSFGAEGEVLGEVCFNTSMTGYQEILTDPSYNGQIVTMTYPQIGNYGINPEDMESEKPRLSGFVVRECSNIVSNFRANVSLPDYLEESGVVGIEGIDTRALVRKLRNEGSMRGVLSTDELSNEALVEKAQAVPSIVGQDLVRAVMPEGNRDWDQGLSHWNDLEQKAVQFSEGEDDSAPHVVAIDYGMKWNIPRHLKQSGCKVTVVPGTITADEIRALQPDGIFLSNGPGDPEPLEYAIQTIREVMEEQPIFGICLGHQLLSLACGAKTFKLKFGHRGANQPVLDQRRNLVEITSQNHGFAVDRRTMPENLEVTHINLNDGTIEGVRHRNLPVFSVQYHPEASAGPHDSNYLFQEFRELMNKKVASS
ncbi:Carbamoyl-phosphate synthase small chain [Planctomycetales bacterium 10988]|nr:Carbamoyl-phosphate synthase small chain [Planctomycetales bacterium 10988]